MCEWCGLSSNQLCEKTRSTGAELAGEHNMRSKNYRNNRNSALLKISDSEVNIWHRWMDRFRRFCGFRFLGRPALYVDILIFMSSDCFFSDQSVLLTCCVSSIIFVGSHSLGDWRTSVIFKLPVNMIYIILSKQILLPKTCLHRLPWNPQKILNSVDHCQE